MAKLLALPELELPEVVRVVVTYGPESVVEAEFRLVIVSKTRDPRMGGPFVVWNCPLLKSNWFSPFLQVKWGTQEREGILEGYEFCVYRNTTEADGYASLEAACAEAIKRAAEREGHTDSFLSMVRGRREGE